MENSEAANWQKTLVKKNSSLHNAARSLSNSSLRIVLVIDDDGKLLGTVTDGDIRRGLLRGLTLQADVSEVIRKDPLVAPTGMSIEMIRQLMLANKIYQIPEVDETMRVLNLHIWDDFSVPKGIGNKMVIMAGGKGTRLHPHTLNCPKPMLLVNEKPILQHIIERARDEGFHEFILSVNYLANFIKDFFEDGKKFGVSIKYIQEESPLGTAGALSLMENLIHEPIVVINGDVITDVKYSNLLDFHKRQNAIGTMAVRLHEWHHPFGVVQMNGLNILGFEEKPIIRTHINAGIYALSSEATQLLNYGEYCDMPLLFEKIKAMNGKVVAYPMYESWSDIGRHEDLLIANQS